MESFSSESIDGSSLLLNIARKIQQNNALESRIQNSSSGDSSDNFLSSGSYDDLMNEVNPSKLNQTEKYKIQKQSSFNDHVAEVKEIIKIYGMIRIPIKNHALYDWTIKNKKKYKKGLLSPDKLKIFKEIGLVDRWDKEDE